MNILRLFVYGFFIGIANIIPGMSGGTIALVLGIYERLISAIHNIGLTTIKRLLGVFTFRKKAFLNIKHELQRIDFGFLCLLGIGAFAAVLVLSELIVYLLHTYHDATYGFFFGLVLTSILIPLKLLKGFSWRELIILLAAISIIVFIEELKKQAALTTNEVDGQNSVSVLALAVYFGCGALAISAMILPGVSGSFLLLAFGVYFSLLTTIKGFIEEIPSLFQRELSSTFWDNTLIIVIFTLGCLLGLIAFTRLINYLLERYRNLTISFLVGLMLGSLYSLWPFRGTISVGERLYDTDHLLPTLDMNLIVTTCVFLVGCIILLVSSRLEKETG